MKTTTNQETIDLAKIEKNTVAILKKIEGFKVPYFNGKLKFSKKAEKEKEYLFKILVTKKTFIISETIQLVTNILADSKFAKLEKEDQDFILELEKSGFKDSHYISEISKFMTAAANYEDYLAVLMEENLYINLLYKELNDIYLKLLKIV